MSVVSDRSHHPPSSTVILFLSPRSLRSPLTPGFALHSWSLRGEDTGVKGPWKGARNRTERTEASVRSSEARPTVVLRIWIFNLTTAPSAFSRLALLTSFMP